MSSRLITALLLAGTLAHSTTAHDSHTLNRRVSNGTWYQPDDHPAHALFKRGNTDGIAYAPVGSPEWLAGYPNGPADVTQLPKVWLDALQAAETAGKIPKIPVSTMIAGGEPTYEGLDPNKPEVCSTTYQCRSSNDIWDAPDGMLALSFDDGPLPPSPVLYDFLKSNNVHATHFYIGSNILAYPDAFMQALNNEDDMAVHTWTHPYMTTKTNEELLGEFGWTMEIIHNSTGGRLPKYWRPPYGDSDMRVRAIAKEIFGLTTVIWNQDTDDWSLNEAGGTTLDKIATLMQKWLTGPKSPGLVILEHELMPDSVKSFIDAFPLMKQNGWNMVSLAKMDGLAAYQNADSITSPVTPGKVGVPMIMPAASSASSSPKSGAHQTATSSPPSGSSSDHSHANQKGAGYRMGPISTVLSGLVAILAAAAGSILA
ncbi:carbohydrate esterase family 4 protein [Hygrophoropsis aurantiaca]|uniref:Carbohydrate esterase family 4 protein n=1 Tax=Hygrophoropsis aurantiaca TaxID=72124 RepID=A0ACB8ANP2_9AGAM|nr:carbohydrate esterase family 4 protein [Hygrophoropsis aurantiaca]